MWSYLMTGLVLGLIFFFYLSYSWSDITQRLTILKDGLILRLASYITYILGLVSFGTAFIQELIIFQDCSYLMDGLLLDQAYKGLVLFQNQSYQCSRLVVFLPDQFYSSSAVMARKKLLFYDWFYFQICFFLGLISFDNCPYSETDRILRR